MILSRTARNWLALTATAFVALAAWTADAKADPSDYGIASTEATLSTTQAGAHPDLVQTFDLKRGGTGASHAATSDVTIDLPPGMVGNPSEFPTCDLATFVSSAVSGGDPTSTEGWCPIETQVGLVEVDLNLGEGFNVEIPEPLYNLAPREDAPARLGFVAVNTPVFIDFSVRSDGDYGLTATARGAETILALNKVRTTAWGVPSDPSHDAVRMTPSEAINCFYACFSENTLTRPSFFPRIPFMSNPTSCEPGREVTFTATSYVGFSDTQSAPFPDITGCEAVPFAPEIDLDPTTTRADSPSGLDVEITQDQEGLLHENTLAPAHLKKAVVTMPEGMTLNPAAADGLGSCSEAQIGLISTSPIRFDKSDPTCPNASKVGTAEITTPLLEESLEGSLYLAEQDDNPFDSLLAGYMVAKGSGVILKLAGNFELDPATGQITATFDNNPQQPFSDLKLHFKGGSRGVLVTPPTCGEYEITTEMVPWSAADPDNPTPDEIETQTSEFTVDSAPNGGPCTAGDPNQPGDPADRADLPSSPELEVGTVTPLAGQSSPIVLRLRRDDGEQELTKIDADLPAGLVGKLAGIPQCADAALASIDSVPGTGADEIATPSCPAASQIGYANVGAGAGSTPVYVPGKVYLGGPYDPAGPDPQAPLSIAVVTPVVTGPFDLGSVVIRSALYVDQDDAQIHVKSDRIPTILEGIALHVKDIRVVLNRDGFGINPTNCAPMQTTAQIGGAGMALTNAADDTTTPVVDGFQVSGCGGLDFRPSMSAAVTNGRDGIGRSQHPNVLFNLSARPGDANLKSVSVLLPAAWQIDQANLGNLCSESQLAVNECAGRQQVGSATATTPLLDTPLSGPVYAVSGSGGLPKLAVILHGPPEMPIKLVVRGVTETVGARLLNTFPLVPDAPVSSFALNLNGGPQGYLVNNRNLCTKVKGKGKRKKLVRAPASFADISYFAQNGDTFKQRTAVGATCGKVKKARRGKGKAK